MDSNANESNIVKFKKKRHLNIGIIIFGIIFIYLVATVIMYIMAPRITVYEVRQGSILKDTAYTGLAIRNEISVKASEGGYINYYVPNSSKVKAGSGVYTISNQPLDLSADASEEDFSLTKEEERTLMRRIQNFNHDFYEGNYDTSYHLKNELKNSLTNMSNASKTTQLEYVLSQETSSGIQVYSSEEDGIVVHSVDGLEGLTVETAGIEHLDKSNYKKTEYASNTKISAGDSVYKIITDENWVLMLDLDKETADSLANKNYIKVHFKKDDQTLWADLELQTIGSHYVAYLSFENSMIRYATERYLDVELILEDETGLKIPKTAETEKEFYVVPKSYITQGGNSSNDGVLRQAKDAAGNDIIEFMPVTIYYEDDEIVYLDPNEFEGKTVLLKPESNEVLTLTEKESLKGVYCINKGYAVFKQIHILCESDTYYIVEEGNSYGLSNYDHIALDSTNIKENDVVF